MKSFCMILCDSHLSTNVGSLKASWFKDLGSVTTPVGRKRPSGDILHLHWKTGILKHDFIFSSCFLQKNQRPATWTSSRSITHISTALINTHTRFKQSNGVFFHAFDHVLNFLVSLCVSITGLTPTVTGPNAFKSNPVTASKFKMTWSMK